MPRPSDLIDLSGASEEADMSAAPVFSVVGGIRRMPVRTLGAPKRPREGQHAAAAKKSKEFNER